MPTVLIRSGRNAHEVSLTVGLLLIALYGLLYAPPSASIDAGLTVAQRVMWGVQGVVGTSVTLIGLYWLPLTRRHTTTAAITSLYIERAGQFLVGIGAATYVVVLCKVSTFQASGLVTVISCAIVAASVGRFTQITRGLKRIRLANEARA